MPRSGGWEPREPCRAGRQVRSRRRDGPRQANRVASGWPAWSLILADAASCFMDGCFDLVAFNPPYVPSGKIEDVAVDGGAEGTEVALRFLEEALRVVEEGRDDSDAAFQRKLHRGNGERVRSRELQHAEDSRRAALLREPLRLRSNPSVTVRTARTLPRTKRFSPDSQLRSSAHQCRSPRSPSWPNTCAGCGSPLRLQPAQSCCKTVLRHRSPPGC